MKPRVLLLAALLAAIGAAVFYFLFSSPPSDAASGAVDSPAPGAARRGGAGEKNSAVRELSVTGEKKSRANWEFFAAMENGKMPEPTAEDIARFLEQHGETAVNLVTVFEKTRDRRWLERALELFPNSPIVLMAAVESVPASPDAKPGETYVPNAQRVEFIERLKAADPNNPLPWIFSAQELFKSGQTTDGVAAIRAALERPAFYIYANERMDAAQQLYEQLGLGSVDSSALAMFGLTLPHMGAAHQAARSLMEWQKSAAESGDSAAADDALRLTYHLGRTFATPEASRTLIGQLVGISMEKRALDALPADAQRDWLTVSPAQRQAEMETQKQAVKELVAVSDWLYRSRDESLWAEYLRRNRHDGEQAALTWLKTQKK